jgi:fumarate hydratase subunit beta
MKKIKLPLKTKEIKNLKVGDEVLLTGIIYTARDQAHKRLVDAIKKGLKPPVDLRGQVIYYCGPTPAPPGRVAGSIGPTTSSRMDDFTPALLRSGLKGMIGKGGRSKAVVEAIKRYKAVYFLTYAGCGALLSRYVKRKRLVAYADLGPEAIYELKIVDFPAIVGIDSKGDDIYGSF